MTGIILGGLNYKAIDAITSLGLTSGFKLCLDAGDGASYTSGQPWLDVSGNGYHFNRGDTNGAEATDPTFNGTPGNFSSAEYWGFDGGDYFTLGQANPTWIENLHKNNAVGTLAGWLHSPANNTSICGNNGFSANKIGFQLGFRTSGELRFGVNNGSGVTSLLKDTTALITTGTWMFFATAIDEAAGTTVQQVGATQESVSGISYSSPSASAASFVTQIGRAGEVGDPVPDNGARMAMLMGWDVALTAAQLMSVFNITRSRFGV